MSSSEGAASASPHTSEDDTHLTTTTIGSVTYENPSVIIRDANDMKIKKRCREVAYMKDRSRRQITFSKRKSGLIKKAQDLNQLTGAPVFVVIVSEAQTVFTWASPQFESLEINPVIREKLEECLENDSNNNSPVISTTTASITTSSSNQLPPNVFIASADSGTPEQNNETMATHTLNQQQQQQQQPHHHQSNRRRRIVSLTGQTNLKHEKKK